LENADALWKSPVTELETITSGDRRKWAETEYAEGCEPG
jgi:hypothetical protein